jgi:hypothetical protein
MEEPDFRKETTFKHVLLPLDGTLLAEQIIPSAVDLAGLMDARVTLLRVVRTELPPDFSDKYRETIPAHAGRWWKKSRRSRSGRRRRRKVTCGALPTASAGRGWRRR